MATSRESGVVQHLRRMLLGTGADLTDGQLLESFVCRREESALAALVRRHGPMVWGVCRRVLANHHDAEDAFQATFLVLVRRAASVMPRERVGNWLYGVAHQTALKARAMATKRRARERQVMAMPETAVVDQNVWHDLQPLLDEALSRLPDRYRAALLLCDLEGRTRKEAARQLGLPEGTVASRLARARLLLARRLAKHGLVVSGVALAVVLGQEAASASVPSSVLSATIQAIGLVAAGQLTPLGMISLQTLTLTRGVLQAMLVTKLKTAVIVLLTVGLLGVATSGITFHALAGDGPDQELAQAAQSPQLAQERLDREIEMKLSEIKAQLQKLNAEIQMLQQKREAVANPAWAAKVREEKAKEKSLRPIGQEQYVDWRRVRNELQLPPAETERALQEVQAQLKRVHAENQALKQDQSSPGQLSQIAKQQEELEQKRKAERDHGIALELRSALDELKKVQEENEALKRKQTPAADPFWRKQYNPVPDANLFKQPWTEPNAERSDLRESERELEMRRSKSELKQLRDENDALKRELQKVQEMLKKLSPGPEKK